MCKMGVNKVGKWPHGEVLRHCEMMLGQQSYVGISNISISGRA